MRKIVVLLLAAMLFSFSGYGQEKTIKLLEPERDKGENIMSALANRQSIREIDTCALSPQDLSNVLWAAWGVNRSDGRRTAPTARNMQEITIYAIMPEGAYVYEADKHELMMVYDGDFRSAVAASQDFVNTVPLCLVIVADTNKFDSDSKNYAWVDAGIVSQNISLFCSGMGLATVPRGFMNKDELRKVLLLIDGQEPILNHPIGYPLGKKQ